MATGQAKKFLRRSSEAILAVVLVLLSFLLILSLLGVTFPEGTPLRQLLRGERAGIASTEPRAASETTPRPGAPSGSWEPAVAVLSHRLNKVKDKPADGIAWREARIGMDLFERHAVQTLRRSAATIDLDGRNRIQLGPESLVVLRRWERSEDFRHRRASLVLLAGELRGEISAEADAPVEVALTTPTGDLRVDSRSVPAGSASFKVGANADGSTTFIVHAGSGEVSSGGRAVEVQPGQFVTVPPASAPGLPRPLPDAPDVVAPADGTVIPYRRAPPQVRFRWSTVAPGDRYRWVLARDPEFREVTQEERVEGTVFVHGNLRPGTYYWRVGTVRDWAESEPSPPRRLDMVADLDPPHLQVDFPDHPVSGGELQVRGTAEPGSRVLVAGTLVVLAADGSFTHPLPLSPGLSVVVVEAVDAAGNVAYRSRLVRSTD